MANNMHFVTGTGHWVKILGNPVMNYNGDGREWVFDFTPDDEAMEVFKELKLDDRIKTKGDERGKFIMFRQREKRQDGTDNRPISVFDANNEPWDQTKLIGNGSTLEVKFKYQDYGKGKRAGVYPQAVRVLKHIPYIRQEFAPLPEDSPYVQGTKTTNQPGEFDLPEDDMDDEVA